MSELRANTLSDAAGTGPTDLTEQWANKVAFNYNQGSASTRLTLNVSSITDDATALFDVNLTNAFSSQSYALAVQNRSSNSSFGSSVGLRTGNDYNAGNFQLVTRYHDDTAFDSAMTSGVVVGTLA